MKTCTKCGVEKELGQFSRHGFYSDGRPRLRTHCRGCSNEYQRLFREKNPDYQRRWTENNRDRVIENNRRWRKTNPDKNREKEQRRRSLLTNPLAPVESFLDVDIFERDGWICQICFEPVDRSKRRPDMMSPSLDHRVPVAHPDYTDHGHTRANTQLAHLRCNLRKKDRTV